jgi:hypothetical protein
MRRQSNEGKKTFIDYYNFTYFTNDNIRTELKNQISNLKERRRKNAKKLIRSFYKTKGVAYISYVEKDKILGVPCKSKYVVALTKDNIPFSLYFKKKVHKTTQRSMMLAIKNISVLTINIGILQQRYNALVKNAIPINIRQIIIRRYFKGIRDYILAGNSFNFGFGVSKIRIERRSCNWVNWEESFERKKRLIAENVPLYELVRDEEGKVIGDNGGVQWLDKSLRDIPWIVWNRSGTRVLNISLFNFYPAYHFYKKAFNQVRDNPDLLLTYPRKGQSW